MIDKLEMFIALANEKHFGRAAEVIGVTQPTLSSAMKQLEEHLGVQLIHRGSRYQGLTPEGERALDWALRIVADARALKAEMRRARSGLSGNLRLGVIPTALPMVVDLVAPFTDKHPQVRVSILSRTSAEILEQIDRLELDAGITYLDPAPARRVEVRPLYLETYCLLMRADAPLAHLPALTWGEVGRQALCLLSSDMQNRRIIDRHLAAAGVPSSPMVESNSIVVLVSHVLTGRWMSVVPAKFAGHVVTRGELVAVPVVADVPEAGQQVGLVVAQRDPHTPMLQALIDVAEASTRRRPGQTGQA
ncbi:LysR family transcriptional regulator [Pannonibacter tanglangensis]|uniref:LysR family transcriptional regulator n=1 Tax=Pannonibacter tanglangensis TaxID=2750084 RepID=A0ABW9ZGK9_9HYPH|nr:LysR family transcriptional regulator [Pannonibacter sp. XCT-34]NBN63881.1 LysR family transcriptional regulator [Pannonibacter sp. XCT-34]